VLKWLCVASRGLALDSGKYGAHNPRVRWPFVTRQVHELEVQSLVLEKIRVDQELDRAREREAEWKGRAERAIEQLLARAGTSEPIMREPAAPGDPAHSPFAGMLLKEVPREQRGA
jgi:hypothetical protein